ncbi:hypothetical protein FRUB_01236 [Fimbriiglobus ruber]|uniref:Uncharacterized protein n=1 Tax=Fimbriiglobus ruber TaxID=1908690 RepID=A0A225EH74_9BACT|nr:hypothetical protein FRUB_07917 [Fimbriiglobus ruber]OWK47537.1 hypothetical protein FRUB_01236 [Fimbriiglobus ruber]
MNPDVVLQQTPAEILDYTIDWTTRGLGTDTIATSVWTVFPTDMSAASPAPSFTGTTTTVWLSEGTAGTYYAVTNTITTAGGREMQETFVINCVPQRFI